MPGRKQLKEKKAKSPRKFRLFHRSKDTSLSSRYSTKLSRDDLINAESNLGRTLFGPVPTGHQREFFELKRNVWLWHESVMSPLGVQTEMTIRYEVRPAGVYKRVNQGGYEKLYGAELDNFCRAARGYLNLVKTKLYY